MLNLFQNITRSNIPKFDYHLHTNWTDGNNTVYEMYNKSITEGLESVLFSEHARRSSVDWFMSFANEVRLLPESSCKALVGVEAKVLDCNGNIDSVDDILDLCDLVMASVHRFPNEEKIEKIMGNYNIKEDVIKVEKDLSLAVLENKKVNILGHPFGMSIRRFNTYPSEEDFKEIISQASKTGVAIEVNPYYHKNLWDLIRWCQDYNVLISLGSNAHKVSNVGWVNRILEGVESA